MKLVLLFLTLIAVSFAAANRFTDDEPAQESQVCLNGGSCTAKDFENVIVGTVSVTSCLRGTTFQTDLELLYTSKKVERYGLAWFISATGGSARDDNGVPRTGCNVRTLDPSQNDPAVDVCGDWAYGQEDVSVVHRNITLFCESSAGGIFVLTNICLGWDESASKVQCTKANNPINDGFGPKCDCNNFNTGIVIGCNVCLAPPTFNTPAPGTLNVQCPADVPAGVNKPATDSCGNPVAGVVSDTASVVGECTSRYTVTRTWTATDSCPATITQTQQINVLNNRALTVTAPAPQTVNCPADINNGQSATYVDGCGNTGVTTTYSDAVTPGSCATRYTITRTWTATDACGNQGSATQLITVNNQQPPTVTAPTDQTVQCRSEINNTQQASWVDACGVSRGVCSNFNNGPASGTCIDRETFTRTFTCSDDCGNSGSDTQLITVNNQEAPSITCQSSGNAASCDPARFVDPTGVGACGDSLTYTTSQSDVVTPTSITRSWIGTDRCGNSATCSTTLTCVTGEFCVFTQGYWKTHSFDARSGKVDLTWECCDKDFFNCVNARGSPYHWIDILTTPSRSGPQQLLFISGRQWVAAYLNLERAGKTYLDVANTDFQACFVRLEAIYSTTCSFAEEDRAAIIGCASILDEFNNGLLGVPHCGSDGDSPSCGSLLGLL